jgi:hypothetical protein
MQINLKKVEVDDDLKATSSKKDTSLVKDSAKSKPTTAKKTGVKKGTKKPTADKMKMMDKSQSLTKLERSKNQAATDKFETEGIAKEPKMMQKASLGEINPKSKIVTAMQGATTFKAIHRVNIKIKDFQSQLSSLKGITESLNQYHRENFA